MKTTTLEKLKMQSNVKFDTAIAINALLDKAVKDSGLKDDEAEAFRDEIFELVTADDE